MASQLGLGNVEVEDGDRARAITEAHGARGVAHGGVVYLHPERVRHDEDAGREVLAHELIHIAQSRLAEGTGGGRLAAEREAAVHAGALARGSSVPTVRHGIDLSRPAGDGDHTMLPDTPTKYGVSITLADEKFGPVTVKAYVQGYVKDGDTLEVKDGAATGKLGLASQEAMIRSKGGKVTSEVATSLAKVEGILDLSEVTPFPGLSLKVETKLFEAAFSRDDISLDLVRVALVGELDITKMLAEARSIDGAAQPVAVTWKLAVRAEVRLPASVVADLYRLHRAKRNIMAAREAGIEWRAAKRAAKKAEKRALRFGIELAEHPEELERLNGARKLFAKAEKVWSAAKKSARRAAETMAEAGARLAETSVGRAASRLARNAMKVLPVLDAIMIAQDIYEAGHKLVELIDGNAELALGGGEGGGAQEGSEEEGDGTGTEERDSDTPAGADKNAATTKSSTADGDGSGSGDGSAASTSTSTTDAQAHATEGDGAGAADAKGGTLAEPRVSEADFTAPKHHPVAAEVLRALEVDAGQTGAAISDDDSAVIDQVIPEDLDPTERAELIAYLDGSKGGEANADFVASVVDAMEYVRPNGEKRPEAVARAAADSQAGVTATPAAEPKHGHHAKHIKRAGKSAEPEVIDTRAALKAISTFVNSSPPRVDVQDKIILGGATCNVTKLGARVNMAADRDTATVTVRLDVMRVPSPQTIDTDAGPQVLRIGGSHQLTFDIEATP